MALLILLILVFLCFLLEKPIVGWIVKSMAELEWGITNLRVGQYKAIQRTGDKKYNDAGERIDQGGDFVALYGYTKRGENFFRPNPITHKIEVVIGNNPYDNLSYLNQYLAKNYGAIWYGWSTYNEVKPYRLVRNKIKVNDKTVIIEPKNEIVDSDIDTTSYYVRVEDIEIKGGVGRSKDDIILATFGLEFILESTNPFTTIYKIQPSGSWTFQFAAQVVGTIRKYGSQTGFEEIVAERTLAKFDQSNLYTLLHNLDTYIEDFCGKKIIQINFVEFGDGSTEVATARQKIEKARLEGLATEEEAIHLANAVITKSNAEKKRIADVYAEVNKHANGKELYEADKYSASEFGVLAMLKKFLGK